MSAGPSTPPALEGKLQSSLSCASVWQAGDWKPRAGLGYVPVRLCLKVKIEFQAFSFLLIG